MILADRRHGPVCASVCTGHTVTCGHRAASSVDNSELGVVLCSRIKVSKKIFRNIWTPIGTFILKNKKTLL